MWSLFFVMARETIESLFSVPDTLYVLDTSGIITLGELDTKKTARFIREVRDSCIVTPEIMNEVRINNGRRRNRHTKVISDTLYEAVAGAYAATQELHQHISQHPMYDTHRWIAMLMASQNCSDKKITDDPISVPDTHILGSGLTFAAHKDDFHKQYGLILLVSTDEHITGTLGRLKNSIYGSLDPTLYEGRSHLS
jgi:hypothetical protein